MFVAATVLFGLMSGLSMTASAQTRTWITDVTIVSPERLDRIAKGSVLIENGVIVRVDRDTSAAQPTGATVVPGRGRFLIPGLIDSHIHLAGIPGVQPESSFVGADRKPAMIREYLRQLPRSYLYFGYTTLVDLAVTDRGVLDDFRRSPVHPDLYDCGPSLPVANGYPMGLLATPMSFRLYPNFLADNSQTAAMPPTDTREDHSPAAAVARVKTGGGICVKTYFDRGYGNTANLPVIRPDMLAAVRSAARQNGLVLVMHANSLEAQRFAVDGDVDVIAHSMWNWGALGARPDLPPEIKTVLDRIVEKRMGYQTTMQVVQGFRAYFDPAYLDLPSVQKVVPRRMFDWFKSAEGQWFKAELLAGASVPDSVMRQAYDRGQVRHARQVLGYLAAKDANLLFRTDTPAAPSYGNLPGLNGYLEMRQLEHAGVSLTQLFKAATIDNARAFKLDSRLGTIEPGKVANLLLLETSPLESVDAYDRIVTVWIHGKAVARESLAANSER